MKFAKSAIRFLPAVLWTAAILYLTTQPMPEKVQLFPHFDKVMHFGAFALLSILTAFAVRGAYPLISIVFVPSTIGAIVEYLQSRLPYRSACLWDFVANFTGTVAVFAVFMLYRKILANSKHRLRD